MLQLYFLNTKDLHYDENNYNIFYPKVYYVVKSQTGSTWYDAHSLYYKIFTTRNWQHLLQLKLLVSRINWYDYDVNNVHYKNRNEWKLHYCFKYYSCNMWPGRKWMHWKKIVESWECILFYRRLIFFVKGNHPIQNIQ